MQYDGRKESEESGAHDIFENKGSKNRRTRSIKQNEKNENQNLTRIYIYINLCIVIKITFSSVNLCLINQSENL